MLLEKLHKTYIFAAMWNREKWLNVESTMGEHRAPTEEKNNGRKKKHKESVLICFNLHVMQPRNLSGHTIG